MLNKKFDALSGHVQEGRSEFLEAWGKIDKHRSENVLQLFIILNGIFAAPTWPEVPGTIFAESQYHR